MSILLFIMLFPFIALFVFGVAAYYNNKGKTQTVRAVEQPVVNRIPEESEMTFLEKKECYFRAVIDNYLKELFEKMKYWKEIDGPKRLCMCKCFPVMVVLQNGDNKVVYLQNTSTGYGVSVQKASFSKSQSEKTPEEMIEEWFLDHVDYLMQKEVDCENSNNQCFIIEADKLPVGENMLDMLLERLADRGYAAVLLNEDGSGITVQLNK